MQHFSGGIWADFPEANELNWHRSCSTLRSTLCLEAGWFRRLQWRSEGSRANWETVSSGRYKWMCWHGLGIFYSFGNLFQQRRFEKFFFFFFESPTIITRMLWNPEGPKVCQEVCCYMRPETMWDRQKSGLKTYRPHNMSRIHSSTMLLGCSGIFFFYCFAMLFLGHSGCVLLCSC